MALTTINNGKGYWTKRNKPPEYKEAKSTAVDDPLDEFTAVKVEQAYVPTKVAIERMMAAGERLMAWKKEMFDEWMNNDE